MVLQENIKKYIERQSLFTKKSRLLLAVSGGADSMAMLYLLTEMGYRCEVAHVNFQLRGADSGKDQKAVEEACKKLDLPLHLKVVDTLAYAKEYKMSIEMAARDIRYAYFEELLEARDLDCVVVAHHQNDVVETFFINLLRGTGLRGLSGISAKKHKVVRPLLECTHQQLMSYLEEKDIPFCVDKSNFDTTILRNKLRHDIIPEMEDRKPGFSKIMQGSIARLKESEAVVEDYIRLWRKANTHQEEDDIYIDKEALYASVSPSEILYHLLRDYGFSVAIIDEVASNAKLRVGASYYAYGYRLLVDRKALIVSPTRQNEDHYIIKNLDGFSQLPISIEAALLPGQNIKIEKKKEIAYFDYSKVEFPLTLRHWQVGDVFCPFGMGGKQKKLSDYFIDEKIPQTMKDRIWLLCSNGQIMWVMGYRPDERFCLSNQGSQVLKLHIPKL